MVEFEIPWTPPGMTVAVPGRGEFFIRSHRHLDPDAPVVLLLHGWTASSDLQFVAAYRALVARYSVIGIDHRGHGRGLRSPHRFQLEDVADDAAAVVRQLGIERVVAVGYSMGGPVALHLARRHRELVAGLVVQASALEWRATWRERTLWRVLPIGGSWLRSRGYRWYLNRAVSKVVGLDSEYRRYVPWIVSEMARNDPFAMVDAGRALGDYDARPWAAALDVPAGSLVTTQDRLVRPDKQRALAAALRATVRELPGDHLAALANPVEFAALTVELIDLVVAAGRQPEAPADRSGLDAVVEPSPPVDSPLSA